MTRRNRFHLFNLGAVVILCALLEACTFNFNLGSSSMPFKETVVSGEGENKVLLIPIEGMISNRDKKSLLGGSSPGFVESVRETLAKAEQDPSIKAVWLRVNSPGGTVTASDVVYHELLKFKEKKRLKIYVSIMDLAASGAYYIAMAGDQIIAHPTSLVGSVGVIAVKVDMTGLLEKIGVDFEVVKSGDKKDFWSPWRPFTELERKLFQEAIDSFHERFVNIIAENRDGLEVADVQKFADGRILTAEQAMENKLVDGIAYLDEVQKMIETDLGGEIKVVSYYRPGRRKSNIYSNIPQQPALNILNLQENLFPADEGPYFMYVWLP